MVVFKDADLDKAANDAVAFSLFNCGQVCCAVERVYVDESIQNEFEQKVLDVAKKYKVGNPTDADTTIGPLASQVQRDNVSKQVEAAVKEGAKVLYQSDCPDDRHANFYPLLSRSCQSKISRHLDLSWRCLLSMERKKQPLKWPTLLSSALHLMFTQLT